MSSDEKRRIAEAITKEAAFIQGGGQQTEAETLNYELDYLSL